MWPWSVQPQGHNVAVVLSQPQGHNVAVVRSATRPQCGCGPFSAAPPQCGWFPVSNQTQDRSVVEKGLLQPPCRKGACAWPLSQSPYPYPQRAVGWPWDQPHDSDIQIIPMDTGQKITVCALCAMWPSSCWIPFGDHPLKLERYRED